MLRLMNINDYEEVYNLWRSTEGMGLRNLDDSKSGINRFLERNPTTSFVYEIDSKVVGTILCGYDGRRAYIYHTCIDIEYRGRGIGRELVGAVIDSLKKEGINRAGLFVYKKNEIGNSFWRSMEWQERQDLNYYNISLNDKNE